MRKRQAENYSKIQKFNLTSQQKEEEEEEDEDVQLQQDRKPTPLVSPCCSCSESCHHHQNVANNHHRDVNLTKRRKSAIQTKEESSTRRRNIMLGYIIPGQEVEVDVTGQEQRQSVKTAPISYNSFDRLVQATDASQVWSGWCVVIVKESENIGGGYF